MLTWMRYIIIRPDHVSHVSDDGMAAPYMAEDVVGPWAYMHRVHNTPSSFCCMGVNKSTRTRSYNWSNDTNQW